MGRLNVEIWPRASRADLAHNRQVALKPYDNAVFGGYSPGVDSVVPRGCFARKLLYAAGIIEAALGFLVRPGGLIAVIPTIASIPPQ